jgi:hypothetical protein
MSDLGSCIAAPQRLATPCRARKHNICVPRRLNSREKAKFFNQNALADAK